ncbi:MAG TPA: decarboxylase [Candidatus Limnocylindria bacterium]|nr:decarboxylase [Candidatus Limnocylindria bacterium]
MPEPLDAPLAVAWERHLTAGARPFVIPGHKGSTDLVGPVVAGDVPLFAGVSSMRGAPAALREAEASAAALWGADWCRFSVAGSTHGNQAMALAVGQPGDVVVATRGVHRSLLLGFVLADLVPVWVQPDIDPVTGLPATLPVERVAAALAAHPGARAVFVVEPGYGGARSDVEGFAGTSHAAGVPLVVDQAWGAHLGFHPALAPHALACGADAFVTSAHKALPAYTQAALVCARTERLDRDRLDRAFEATHTTSPSGTIIASIDAARALLARDGERLLGATIALVAQARERLAAVPGLVVLDGPSARVDPTRVAVGLAGTGAHGLDVEDDLEALGFAVELADRDSIVATVTMADSPDTVGPFVDALIASIERRRGDPRGVVPPAWLGEGSTPEAALTPRQAFFAPHETVASDRAAGRVAAELVAPYPPGIPAIVPGEVLTGEVLDALRAAAARGVRVAYAADATMATVQVVARR